jgi:hypothetical protein
MWSGSRIKQSNAIDEEIESTVELQRDSTAVIV